MITNPNITFGELASIWFENAKVGLSYSYVKETRCMINHLNAVWFNIPVREITALDINSLVTSLSIENPNTHKPASKSFLTKLVNIIFNIFELAVDDDIITKNPARNKGKKIIPKNAPKKQIGAITAQEKNLVLAVDHRCKIAAMVMMYAGLRASELIALKWSDVDFQKRIIYVNKHAVRNGTNHFEVRAATKNKRSRRVTIPHQLIAYLMKEKQKNKFDYIFPKTDGSMNTPSSWKSAWNSYNKELSYQFFLKHAPNVSKFDPKGIPQFISINPHQLRHTYTSMLYESGVDILTMSKLLGHSGVELTLNTYTHLNEEHELLDITKFDEFLSSDQCII